MPNILFASNNTSHWPSSTASTTGGTFDSARVPYSFALQYKEAMISPRFTPPEGDVTWFHFRLYVDSSEFSDSTQAELIRVFDANGDTLFVIFKKIATSSHLTSMYLYDGTTFDLAHQNAQFTGSFLNAVDIRHEASGSVTNLKLYMNGGLVAEANIDAQSSRGKPAYFTMAGALVDADNNEIQRMSEFIVADGDTRNAHLNFLRPLVSGAETAWVGEAAHLADDDPTTGMTTIFPEQRQTLQLSEYTGAPNISSMVIITQTYVGVNGPQNLEHTVRMGGVNYEHPDNIPVADTLQFNLTDFQINPGTSQSWIEADLAMLEIGFLSKE